jgi:hypothetical protein
MSGYLCRYYYDKKKNKFMTQILDKNNDFASVYAVMNDHKLLISKKKKIYMINYAIDKNSNELIVVEAKKITENKFNSANMTYSYNDSSIIVSQKINNYYQLVEYNNKEKNILTTSLYHKQDPTMSPCGNYIAYIAQTSDGDRYVEVLNKYSLQVVRVTKSPGEYRFPVWLVR